MFRKLEIAQNAKSCSRPKSCSNTKSYRKDAGQVVASPNAPINVKPLGERPGIGGGFDVTSLPAVGTFDHPLSSFDQQ